MSNIAKSLAVLLLCGLVAAPSLASDLADRVALEAFVDGVVTSMMRSKNSPSGTVAIAHNGELIFAKGYGYLDVDKQVPVDPETTLFRPGSVSKLATWISVMQLVEQGKLDLDADVNTYLENFKIRDTFPKPVTLRHVLTHTAGFEDGAVGYLILDDPGRIMPLAEAMARYQPARVNPPGKQTSYSNYATALAGVIVENVSGLSFADYVQQNVFAPLGMTHSSFEEPLPESLADNMAESYKVEVGRYKAQPFEIISNFGPAGAQSSSATDMVRFGQAILNGGEFEGQRIIGADTLELMLTRAFSHDDRLMGMALGFYEQDINGFRVVGHGGDTQYFHSFLGVDHVNQLTFFVSFGGPGGSEVRTAFTPAFYDEYFPQTVERPMAPEGFTERAGKYAGTYAFWRSNFSTIEKALGLSGGVQVAPTEDDTLVLSFGGGAKQYVEVDTNLFRELDRGIALVASISPQYIAFQENEAGEVTGFVMDGLPFMSLRKLSAYETPTFNFALLGLSLFVLLGFALRRFFQRREIATFSSADRSAIRAAFYASAAHLTVFVVGAVVLSMVMDEIFSGLPMIFKAWLVLPVIATLVTLYFVYKTVGVWKNGLLASTWARVRYSVVTLAALFPAWFYWFFNILGFQYLQ